MSEWELVEGRWLHRPWWKVAINTVLRALQTRERPADLWVIYTKTRSPSRRAADRGRLRDRKGPPPPVIELS